MPATMANISKFSPSISPTESSSDLNDFGDMGAAGVTKQMSPSTRALGQREGMTTSPRLLLTTTSTDNNTFSLYLTLNLRRASAVFQTHIKSSRTSRIVSATVEVFLKGGVQFPDPHPGRDLAHCHDGQRRHLHRQDWVSCPVTRRWMRGLEIAMKTSLQILLTGERF